MRYTPDIVTYLAPNEVYVFGSTGTGIHDYRNARQAMKYGAVMQQNEGHFGQTYAIPIWSEKRTPLPLADIQAAVERFISYALSRPELIFRISDLGLGLARILPVELAPFFVAVHRSEQFTFTIPFKGQLEILDP